MTPNPDFAEVSPREKPKAKKYSATSGRAKAPKFVKKTAAWGGLPGKAQPSDRSGGVKKLPIHPKATGL